MSMVRRKACRVGGLRSAVAAILAWCGVAAAGVAPESTLLVVNEASWASRTIAQAYVDARRVPAGNIVLLRGVSSIDRISVGQFREEILGPVLRAMDERGLRGRIDCVVYSVDLPWVVDVGGDLPLGRKKEAGDGDASITGLTYLHQRVLARDARYLRHDANRYYRAVVGSVTGAPLEPHDELVFQAAMGDRTARRYPDAVAKLGEMLKTPRRDPAVAYALACCLSATGKPEEALAALRDAASVGWRNLGQAEQEPDLAAVRELPAYKAFAAALAEEPVKLMIPEAFTARAGWGPDGAVVEGGESYLLSTMLGVTSGRGNAVDEVVDSIRRSASVDFTRPSGSIVLGRGQTEEAKLRAWAFTALAEQLQKEKVRAVTINTPAPASAMRVAGGVFGAPGVEWRKSESTILPGAICDNLSRAGGLLMSRDAGASGSACTDLLRAGAAGTSGLVGGPVDPAHFASPYVQYFYVRGFSLAESYYQSVGGPARLLILGDPMCTPWAPDIRMQILDLTEGQSVRGAMPLPPFEKGGYDLARQNAFIDGELVAEGAAGDELVADTTKFGDGPRVLTYTGVMRNQVRQCARYDLPVRVANHNRGVEYSAPPKQVTWGQNLSIRAKCDGADWVGITHLGRLVGVAAARDGAADVRIDTTQLGVGEVVLRPLAGKGAIEAIERRPGELLRTSTVGGWIRMEIVATSPAALAESKRPKAPLEPGLLLSVRGEAPRIVTDCTSPEWPASIKPGRTFELVGYFRCEVDTTYQIQLRTREAVEVEIDGWKAARGGTGEWTFVPVRLAAGEHRVRVFGQIRKDPRIDLRMGHAGTDGLSAAWCLTPRPVDPAVAK